MIELSRGRTRAVVLPEAGGRLHQLSIHDGARWLPLLRTPSSFAAHVANPVAGGSFVMAPWPGRIAGARFLWQGRLYDVPANDGAHALHGRTVYQPWTVEWRTAAACRLSCKFDAGWPFRGHAVQEIGVLDRGVSQRIEVHAARGERFPAGAGWHPWFRRSIGRGDVRVQVDAAQTYATDEIIPTGWLPLVQGDLDLRSYPVLGQRRIDACYRHPRGPLRIRWGDIELTMTSSPNITHAVVYTPRHAVCIEPQTCAPDAFNLDAQGVPGAGMTIVDAHHPLIAATIWRWSIGAR